MHKRFAFATAATVPALALAGSALPSPLFFLPSPNVILNDEPGPFFQRSCTVGMRFW